MPLKDRELVDKRHGSLVGTSNWVRAAAMPFQRTGSCKAADWMKLIEVGMEYCFAGVVPASCEDAFWGLAKLLREMLLTTCDVADPDELHDAAHCRRKEDRLRQLKRQCALALSRAEEDTPLTESAICMHIIMHIPETIYRWNSVRNTWAFPSERFATFLTISTIG
jgi:hypothetical protein